MRPFLWSWNDVSLQCYFTLLMFSKPPLQKALLQPNCNSHGLGLSFLYVQERLGSHLMLIKSINKSYETTSLCPFCHCKKWYVTNKDCVKMLWYLQIVTGTKRLKQNTTEIHDRKIYKHRILKYYNYRREGVKFSSYSYFWFFIPCFRNACLPPLTQIQELIHSISFTCGSSACWQG